MAVIVLDMEMPETCAYCEFGKRFDNGSSLCERKPNEPPVPDWNGKPDWCPLRYVR